MSLIRPIRPEFLDQRPDEKILAVLHRHWVIWFWTVGQLVLFNVLPLGLYLFFVYALGWSLPTTGPMYVAAVLFGSVYYLGAWLMYYRTFIDFHLDIWVITDQRIVNIEQEGLFDRVVSELNIHKVQDVTSEVNGHLQTFLHFGNVYVQTAAEKERFIFENIPQPEAVARLIIHTNDAARRATDTVTPSAPTANGTE